MDIKTSAKRPPVNRWWLRFSLRTLMIVCLLISPVLAYLGNIGFHVRRQRAVVKRIESLSGYVRYEHEVADSWDPLAAPPGPEIVRRYFGQDAYSHVQTVHAGGLHLGEFHYQPSQWTNADLHILANLPRLRHLEVGDLAVDDQGIKYVAQIRQLNRLYLGSPKLSADGLAQLKNNRSLERLDILGEAVTDETLRRIGELSHLKHLEFSFVNVSSARIEKLEVLAELRTISFLHAAKIDDRSLRTLAKLPKLESVTFFDCEIGDEGPRAPARASKLARTSHLRNRSRPGK